MKKLGTAICFLASVGASTAQAAWEGNWLLGVSGSYEDRDNNLYLTLNHPTGAQTNYNREFDDNGFEWGLLAGYQVMCNHWLFGLEVNVNWQDHENIDFAFTDALSPSTGWDATASYKRETVVGVTGRLGVDLGSCFLPYVRLGAEGSRDKVTFEAFNANDSLLIIGTDGSETVYRWVAGIGVEMLIRQVRSLSLRLEYLYHSKGKGVDAEGFASIPTTAVDATIKQSINEGRLALVWNFG